MKFHGMQNKLAMALAVIVTVIAGSMLAAGSHTEQVAIQQVHAPRLLANAGSASSSSENAGATTSPSESTSTPVKTVLPTVVATTSVSRAASQQITQPNSNSTNSTGDLNASGQQLLSSVVNIVCLSADSSVPSITGSGVIIDPRGIILTAAHVAQLFLLQDYLGPTKVQCFIRNGSPARRAYLAEPIYVSKSWLDNNPTVLTSSNPLGNGQNDVALLGITDTATSTPLPSSFPYIPLATSNPQAGDKVAVSSYGAQYLTGDEINHALYHILVFGTIKNRYTYSGNTIDLISIIGGAASQEGSSGGGIANAQGQLIGIISTSAISGDFNTRTLNAITPLHLRQTYLKDTGNNLDASLQNESVAQLIAGFAGESKQLGTQLMNDVAANGK